MLPEYQQFAQLLEQMQAASQQQDVIELRSRYQKAQQFFLEQILTLEPADNYQIRSYQTEIAKELQLIGMDVRFLQAAKVPETSAIRQKQLLARLPTLLKYCNAILQLTTSL